MIEILPLGGYREVGKNMTAIKIDNQIIILDIGIHLPNYIKYTEDEDIILHDPDSLIKAEVIPNYKEILKENIIAIIPTHGHLDHVGGIIYVEKDFNCPIICTPYTGEVIYALARDAKIKLKNKILQLNTGSKYKLTNDIEIEFIRVTHSIPHTTIISINTKYGSIIYSNDFKFDDFPTLGKKPDYKALENTGKKKVLCLITESLYVEREGKMPGESIAKQMLKEVLLSINNNKAIIVTTFSSHIARLKEILKLGEKLNRKVLFLGRSMSKYLKAAHNVNLINYNELNVSDHRKAVNNTLKKVMKEGKNKYLLVVTGHQGEEKAILNRMAQNQTPFIFEKDDNVIFSCTTIPTEITIENRKKLEKDLHDKGVIIYKDVHVSGHAAKEDLRKLIRLLNAKYLIPSHSEYKMMKKFKELALEEKYNDKQIIFGENGKIIKIKP